MPYRVPGLKWLAILTAVYSIIWISLEGKMWQVLVLSCGLTILMAGAIYQRRIGGRTPSISRWLLLCALAGAVLGLLFGPLTILLMVLKTGLHGHGPEFTPEEINWIIDRIPLFMILGALITSGLGALLAGFNDRSASN
jgi:hypothetical protein